WKIAKLGSVTVPRIEAMKKAGSRLYLGAANQVCAIDLPLKKTTRVSWQAPLEGKPVHMAVAVGRLLGREGEGRSHCFGPTRTQPRSYRATPRSPALVDSWTTKAAQVLETTGVRDGYCLAWGVGTGRLVMELARQSRLHLIVIDPDVAKMNRFRSELSTTGLDGERVAALAGDPRTMTLPPYLASLMVAEEWPPAGVQFPEEFVRKMYVSLRPYGGGACLPVPTAPR